MQFIEFDAQKCDECYRCLRACPTKAIAFTGSERKVLDDRCIKCGICRQQCEKGALRIHLDIEHVRDIVRNDRKIVASLAPSHAGAFPLALTHKLPGALRYLGFFAVEETAVGADLVSEEYEKIITRGETANIITSCCPASNYLVEQYYPEALEDVIHIVSPMVAHGRDIKARYGEDTVVVFIGPCMAKKAEAMEFADAVDAVITFRELKEWLDEENLDWDAIPVECPSGPASVRGRSYPLGGSLWRADMKSRINRDYRYERVDGIQSCNAFLSGVRDGTVTGFCAELNICQGSCMNGPDMPDDAGGIYERIARMMHYIERRESPVGTGIVSAEEPQLKRTFEPKPIAGTVAKAEVEAVLVQMGKSLPEERINCGACGYTTCEEKARAVALGHSNPEMCLDRLRKQAENIRSIIFENSPNAICLLDPELRLLEVNPAFHQLFNPARTNIRNWPVRAFIDHAVFEDLLSSGRSVFSRKIRLEDPEFTCIANLVRLEAQGLFIGIFTDVTADQRRRDELKRVKEETVRTCQTVIDRQMRVVQEIASLLGETAAETKVGLSELKHLILSDGGE